jgi:hypothetical protein
VPCAETSETAAQRTLKPERREKDDRDGEWTLAGGKGGRRAFPLPRAFSRFYAAAAISTDSFARAVAFAIGQPDDVDISEILFRPTHQNL